VQTRNNRNTQLLYPQVVTDIHFCSNMSELCAIGPNGFFQVLKVSRPDMRPVPDDECAYVGSVQAFIGDSAHVTCQSWSELVDKAIPESSRHDGKIMAVCSDQGHLCIVNTEVEEPDEEYIVFQSQYKGRSFACVELIRQGMIAVTFDCEFLFFQLILNPDESLTYEELREWSLFNSEKMQD
jgi:hypothetical protein